MEKMKVIFFGAGGMLKDILEKSEIIHYLDVRGVLDNNPTKWGRNFRDYQVQHPDEIKNIDYDKVIISTISTIYFSEIFKCLTEKYHIGEHKIASMENLIVPDLCRIGNMKIAGNRDCCYDMRDLIAEKRIVPQNDLERFFFYDEHRIIYKWWHYFEIYDAFFHKYRNKPVKMLEIGVFRGGSLQMWKDYFGKDALIIGIDLNPECKLLEEERIEICIGSQDDPEFLRSVSEEYGDFDIVLDDGSHMMQHQITSFECLFPRVKDGGLYLCEDLHSSYIPGYGGMLYGKDTFVEYSKNWIDGLQEQYVDNSYKKFIKGYTPEIRACHFYNSMVVLEKSRKKRAIESMNGRKYNENFYNRSCGIFRKPSGGCNVSCGT